MSADIKTKSDGHFRILMQTRPNVFTQRGGDTSLLEKLSDGLNQRGHDVEIDITGAACLTSFDLVHLFNFATPALTTEYARRATQAGVPFVVTTLYEDLPTFHRQSHYLATELIEYVKGGQKPASFNLSQQQLRAIEPAPRFAADEIARNATVLMANGEGEASALRRDFPQAQRIISIPVGSNIGNLCGPELFEKVYGERDFILCVGRLESRKNQLMLLKALEDSPLTVVLAGGGFSYQPEYDSAIRAFKRRGKTIILGLIDPQMLASAYAACRMHVLPSWYELPGLVSLEAAARNKNIVVTKTGTTADYIGDRGFYCLPYDEDSIRTAVTAAYYSPVQSGLAELARSYTWDKSIDKTEEVYRDVCQQRGVTRGDDRMNDNPYDFSTLIELGEAAAKRAEFDTANDYLAQAAELNPDSTRLLKAQGAVFLAQMKPVEATAFFDRALATEPNEPKLLVGRGMCELLQNKPDLATDFFERSLDIEPDYIVAIYQILECAYALGDYGKALSYLTRYLQMKPADLEIRFCMAGCLFKNEQIEAAEWELDTIERANPEHVGAKELRRVIRERTVNGSGQRTESEEVTANTPATTQALDMRIAEAISNIEELKRSGEFTVAYEALTKLNSQGDLAQPYRDIVDCLGAEFTVLGGDLAAAGRCYDEILARSPGCARAMCGKGALAAEAQDWRAAQVFFNEALALDPESDVAYAGLGICSMTQNETDKAFGYFQAATERNPENHRAILGLLQTGYPLKRYTEMERILTAYLDLHPASLDMLYSFAGLLFAQGKVNEAKLEVEKILIFEPQHENALELHGIIQEQQGEERV